MRRLTLLGECHAGRTAQVRSGGRRERKAAGRQPPREMRCLAERPALAWHHHQQSDICIRVRLAVGVGAEKYDLVGMKRMGNRVTQAADLLPSLTAEAGRDSGTPGLEGRTPRDPTWSYAVAPCSTRRCGVSGAAGQMRRALASPTLAPVRP